MAKFFNATSRGFFVLAVAMGLLLGWTSISFSMGSLSENSANDTPNGYQMYTLTTIAYGDDQEQIGLIAEENMLAGPESFWVTDDGLIYIMDTVHANVKVFDTDGRFIQAIGFEGVGNDIAVDENKNMYIFEHRNWQVHQLNANGTQKAIVTAKHRNLQVPRHFRFSGTDLVMMDTQQNEYVVGRSIQGAWTLQNEMRSTPHNGLKMKGSRLIKVLKNDYDEGEIVITDPSSRSLGRRFKINRKKVASIDFLGDDNQGNIYIQVESFKDYGISLGVQLNVFCLDSAGNIIGAITDIPNNYFTWTTKLLQVNNNGDVYQVLPTQTEVIINVWKKTN